MMGWNMDYGIWNMEGARVGSANGFGTACLQENQLTVSKQTHDAGAEAAAPKANRLRGLWQCAKNLRRTGENHVTVSKHLHKRSAEAVCVGDMVLPLPSQGAA